MQVWMRVRAGDPQAVDAVMKLLTPRVQRMGGYYARRTGYERDELVQEGLMAIVEGMSAAAVRFEAPEMHLVRLARWRMLDWIRRSRRRRNAALEQECAAIDHELAQAGEQMDVNQFVARLSPRQAQIACGLMDGWNWREVAAQMGCSSANLGYHLRKIRAEYSRAFDQERHCA